MRQSEKYPLSSRAFTLIEILLVIALMSMIGLTTYRVLATGLKVWNRGQQMNVEKDLAIFFDKFSLDVRNSFSFSSLALEGGEHHLSFPTVVRVRQDKKNAGNEPGHVRQIGMVAYEFDPDKDGIIRRVANYSQALKKKFGAPQVLVAPVTGLRFRYLYAQGSKFVLEPDTDSGIPLAVEVTIEYKEKNKKSQQISRRVYLTYEGEDEEVF